MARLFTTGAEELDPDAVWSAITLTNRDYPLLSFADANDRLNTQRTVVEPRTGQACFVLNYDNNQDYLTWTPASTITELYLGFGYWAETLPTTGTKRLVNFLGPNVLLEVQNGGTLRMNSQSASAGLSAQTWHYIEVYFKPCNAGGVIQVKLDGTLVLDVSGDTTSSQEYVTSIQFHNGTENACTGAFDDMVVNDTNGAVNNTWPGPVRLLPVRPNAAGASAQWARAGLDLGANHVQAARLGKWGDVPVLQAGATGLKDSFVVDVPDLPAGATITNIIAVARATAGSGSGSIKLGVRGPGGTESQSASQALGAAYKVLAHVVPLNPDDSAVWEEADLSGLQVSIESD
jgi:hypothetical protein